MKEVNGLLGTLAAVPFSIDAVGEDDPVGTAELDLVLEFELLMALFKVVLEPALGVKLELVSVRLAAPGDAGVVSSPVCAR